MGAVGERGAGAVVQQKRITARLESATTSGVPSVIRIIPCKLNKSVFKLKQISLLQQNQILDAV